MDEIDRILERSLTRGRPGYPVPTAMKAPSPERSKRIPHIDELSEEAFRRFLEMYRAGKLEISEKLDGSARISFGVHEGRLWTRSKNGPPRFTAEQYGPRPMYAALREAHRALESRQERIVEGWPAGVSYLSAEVLYTRIPNSIEYGPNAIVVHGVHSEGASPLPMDESRRLVSGLVEGVGQLPGGWRFEQKRIIEQSEFFVQLLDPQTKESVREQLLLRLREQRSGFGGGDVEGVVFLDLEDGSTTKLVDRERFTDLNRFLWRWRERLDRGTREEGVWRPGIMAELRNGFADDVLAIPGVKSPALNRLIARAGRGNGGYPNTQRALVGYVNSVPDPGWDAIERAESVIRRVRKRFNEVRSRWMEESCTVDEHDVNGRAVAIDPLIRQRERDAFDDMDGYLDDLEVKVGAGRVLGGKRAYLLSLLLGPERLEKLSGELGGDEDMRTDVNEDPSQPLTSMDMSPAKIGEKAAMEYIERFRELMRTKRHLTIPAKPRHLGTGTRGAAFDIGGGRVLKITADDQEAQAANRLRAHRGKLKHIANIYDVFEFRDNAVYGIVQDLVQKISAQEAKEVNDSLIATGLPVWLKKSGHDWEEAKKLVIDWLRKKAKRLSNPDEARELLTKANESWQLLVNKYHLKEMIQELGSVGIKFQDFHAGNVMKNPAGDYVLIDIGYSQVSGAEKPDVLERLVREMVTELEAPEYPPTPEKVGAEPQRRPGDPAGGSYLDQATKYFAKFGDLLKKNGVDVTGSKELGQGSYGVAMSVRYRGKPAVLKLTMDHTEAKTSNHLKGKKTKHIVNIYEVFRFPNPPGMGGKNVYFGIVQEQLSRMSEQDETDFEELVDFLEKAQVGTTLFDGDIRAMRLRVVSKLGKYPARRFDELVSYFKFDKILREIVDNRVLFIDYHSGNLMKRGSEFVVIDLGQSRSPGVEPPVLEKAPTTTAPHAPWSHSDDEDENDLKRRAFGFVDNPKKPGHYGQYTGLQIAHTLERAAPLLKKNGIELDFKKRLGAGAFGIAFLGSFQGKPAALKITGETDEAKAYNHLKGKTFKHLSHVYDVWRLPPTSRGPHDQFLTKEGKPLFLIAMEVLTKIGSTERKEFNELLDIIRYVGHFDNMTDVWETTIDEVDKIVAQGFRRQDGEREDDDDSPSFSTYDQYEELSKKFDLAGMMADVSKSKIDLFDVHDENIMKRGADYVLIDPGMAESPGALPDVMERITRGMVVEGKVDTVGVTIGRYQPFHKGHAEIVRQLAQKYTKVVVLVAGNKRDKNNPFSYELRLDMMKKSLPDVSGKIEVYKAEMAGKATGYLPGILSDVIRDHNSSVEAGTAINILVGPDRVEDIKKQMEHARQFKGRGEEMLFDPDLAVVKTLEGVRNDDDTDRISGTKIREALLADKKDAVMSMLDAHVVTVEAEFEELYSRMRDELGVKKESKINEDLKDIGEEGVEGLLKVNAVPLFKGYRIDVKKAKKLGHGQMGVAYDIGNDRVLKVTTDSKEANTSSFLKGKQSPHVVDIIDIFKFPTTKSMDVYGIVQEKLKDLSPEEMREFDILADWLRHDDVIDKTATGNWPDVEAAVRTLIVNDIRGDLGLPPEPPASTGVKGKMEHRAQQLIDAKFVQFQNLASKFSIDTIIPELRALRIEFADFHGKNMMKRGSDFVINDLGQSNSPGGPTPPVLENLVESLIGSLVEGKKSEKEEVDLGFGFNEDGYALQGRYEFQGLDIAVENKKGSDRQWGDKPSQSTRMKHDYGYVVGYEGADGDEVDVYIGPDKDAEWAYVVHQLKTPKFKKFDEDKVMLGFSSEEKAKKAYLAHYDKEDFYGGMSAMKVDDFKKRIKKREGKKITNENLDKITKEVIESLGNVNSHGVRAGTSGWSAPSAMPDPDDEEGDGLWQRNLTRLQPQSPKPPRKTGLPKEK